MANSSGRSRKSWVSPTWLQSQLKLSSSTPQSRTSSTERLVDFIPRVSPRLEAPHHLAPYLGKLEMAPGAGLKIVFAAPPQHGKTEGTTHGLVRSMQLWPHYRNAYATYNDDRTQRVSRNAADI